MRRAPYRVDVETFRGALHRARAERAEIAAATTAPDDLPGGLSADWYLYGDRRAGFGVRDGELLAVFAVDRGRGDRIIRDAIARGARRLDCFDGYLPRFYGRHGFAETRREPNWAPGGPDVVYMARADGGDR